MKTSYLKKAINITIAVTMLFSLAACGGRNEQAAATTNTPVAAAAETAYTYDISGNENMTVDGQTFDGSVIITGENGKITFTNCVFKGDVINNGGEGAKVFVWADCQFTESSKCVIDSTLEEATMDTDLPKFMIFCAIPDVVCKKAGAVVATAEQVIRINDSEYPVDTAEYYVNESTGEFAPYSDQEVNMHNVSMWAENGETVQMHVAIYAAE